MVLARRPTQRGRVIPEEISISVGGQAFNGWQSVSITKNIESIANQFSIDLFNLLIDINFYPT